jgi:hypothetical protein
MYTWILMLQEYIENEEKFWRENFWEGDGVQASLTRPLKKPIHIKFCGDFFWLKNLAKFCEYMFPNDTFTLLVKNHFSLNIQYMKNIKWMHVALFGALVFTIPGNSNALSLVVQKSVTPYSEEWKNLKASEFVKLSLNDFNRLSGRKMNLKEKISFIIMNKGMKHAIKKDRNLTVREYLARHDKIGKGCSIFAKLLSNTLSIQI